MPALSNPATWRKQYQTRAYLFVHQPTAVFQAQVNMSSATYPVTSIIYNNVTLGAYTDIKEGMTITIGTTVGGDDLGRTRIRKAADSTTIYIAQSSQGYRDGEVWLQNAAYITVWDEYRVWAKIPRFLDDGTGYKDYDIAIGDYGTKPPPIANGGAAYAGFIDISTSVITVNFDASNSVTIAQGASISSYLWDFKDGTITSGSTSSATATVTFPAGFRYVDLTVTDSNGKTHTTHIPVYAANKTTYKPIEGFNCVREHTLDGQILRATVYETLDQDQYPDGALVMLFEDEYYGGAKGSLAGASGREQVKFIGWLQQDSADIEGNEVSTAQSIEIVAYDCLQRLYSLPGFPQVLERDSNPKNWMQAANLTVKRYLHYILQWHSTALDVVPISFDGISDTYDVIGLSSNGGNLGEQLSEIASAIAHRITCDTNGRLHIAPHPNEQIDADRTSVVIVSLDEGDISNISYEYERQPQLYWLNGGAVSTGTEDADSDLKNIKAYFSIAPNQAPSQGKGEESQMNQLVKSQDELNNRTGLQYANRNRRIRSYSVEMAHVGDAGIDPAYLEWVQVTLSSTYAAQRGLTWTNARFLPISVTTEYLSGIGSKNVQIELEPETLDWLPATTYIPPQYEFPRFEFPTFYFPKLSWNQGLNLDVFADMSTVTGYSAGELKAVIVATDNDKVARCLDVTAATPQWDDITGTFTGNVQDMCYAVVSGKLQVRVLTATSSALYVYKTTDALAASVTWSLEATITPITSVDTEPKARIVQNSADNYAAVVWTESKTLTTAEWDGTTWGSAASLSQLVSGTWKALTIGADIQSDKLAIASLAVLIYKTKGGSWSTKSYPETITYYPNTLKLDNNGQDIYLSIHVPRYGIGFSYYTTLDDDEYKTHNEITIGTSGNVGTPTIDEVQDSVGYGGSRAHRSYLPTAGSAGAPSHSLQFQWQETQYPLHPNHYTTAKGWFNINSTTNIDVSVGDGTYGTSSYNSTWIDEKQYGGSIQAVFQIQATGSSIVGKTIEFRLDNISVQSDPTNRAFFWPSYASTSSWTEFTNSKSLTPKSPHGLHVDPNHTNAVTLIGNGLFNSSGLYRHKSNGSITIYGITQFSENARVVKKSLDLALVAGVDMIQFSTDGGDRFVSIIGNYTSKIGLIGEVLNAIVIWSE